MKTAAHYRVIALVLIGVSCLGVGCRSSDHCRIFDSAPFVTDSQREQLCGVCDSDLSHALSVVFFQVEASTIDVVSWGIDDDRRLRRSIVRLPMLARWTSDVVVKGTESIVVDREQAVAAYTFLQAVICQPRTSFEERPQNDEGMILVCNDARIAFGGNPFYLGDLARIENRGGDDWDVFFDRMDYSEDEIASRGEPSIVSSDLALSVLLALDYGWKHEGRERNGLE